MQTSGEVVRLDLGRPKGREAGYLHPAVFLSAQRILDAPARIVDSVGNVGPLVLRQIRETIAVITDIG